MADERARRLWMAEDRCWAEAAAAAAAGVRCSCRLAAVIGGAANLRLLVRLVWLLPLPLLLVLHALLRLPRPLILEGKSVAVAALDLMPLASW